MTDIKRVGVLGCGLMGSGIAQVAATGGYATIVRDVAPEIWSRARANIEKSLAKFVEKGKLPAAARDTTLGLLGFTTDLDALAKSDIVIEAVTEDLALKNKLWKELDGLCHQPTIFASNTSSLPIVAMAAATKRPDRFVGMHFFNPVPVMKLVEVIRALQTDDETCDAVLETSRKVGKTPHLVKDSYGFVVNRVLIPMINEAINCLYEGLAGPDDIDDVMKLGANHPMGPLELADLIGLDVTLNVMQTLYDGFEDSKYRPSPLLKQMVDAGYLGRKTGRGFHKYES
jgi:3-hydroxybutyryl-CoA dehydrogenase